MIESGNIRAVLDTIVSFLALVGICVAVGIGAASGFWFYESLKRWFT